MARWTREELLHALSLYLETPFGKQHQTHPPIVALAEMIGRTPSAVAMKLSNFTSLDPHEKARGIKGLSGASSADRDIWAEYENDTATLIDAVEALREKRNGSSSNPMSVEDLLPSGSTAKVGLVTQRRHQNFFRRVVMSSYGTQCCLTGNPIPELLRASHIVPWSQSIDHRLDPKNGLCLSATFDAAFDRGLITISDQYRLVLGKRIHKHNDSVDINSTFIDREGDEIRMPQKHLPKLEFLQWHRDFVFNK